MKKDSHVHQKLYRYAFWVAILLTILLSITLYIFGENFTWKEQIYAISSSLIASAVFALMFYFLANHEFIDLLRNEFEGKSRDMSESVLSEVKRFELAYFPTKEYPPTVGYDPLFNADITADIDNTSLYLFRGITARFVPARIRYSKQNLSLLRVILLDPQDTASLNLSASDRAKLAKYSGKSHLELISLLREEIYSSVIALFDCRGICSVEVAYAQETAVTRIELFDHSLYLACYHTDRAATLTFPDTLKYHKGSYFYQVHRLDFFRQFEVLAKKTSFRSTDTDMQLMEHLRQIGMTGVDEHELTKRRSQYQEFQVKFAKDIGLLG